MLAEKIQRKIKNTGLVLSLALGLLMLSGVTANAQYNNDSYRRDQRNDQRVNRQNNRRNNQRDNRRDNDDSNRNNTNGYYGNNTNGNNGGYYGNNGYGNNLYQIAQQNGYNDGLRKGQEDAREGHNNPTGTSEYKSASNGYNSSYGNKNSYKDAYRQAFLQGFQNGYNQNYNRNNNGYGNNGNRRRGY